jgi:hypothetical protein
LNQSLADEIPRASEMSILPSQLDQAPKDTLFSQVQALLNEHYRYVDRLPNVQFCSWKMQDMGTRDSAGLSRNALNLVLIDSIIFGPRIRAEFRPMFMIAGYFFIPLSEASFSLHSHERSEHEEAKRFPGKSLRKRPELSANPWWRTSVERRGHD